MLRRGVFLSMGLNTIWKIDSDLLVVKIFYKKIHFPEIFMTLQYEVRQLFKIYAYSRSAINVWTVAPLLIQFAKIFISQSDHLGAGSAWTSHSQ